MSKVTLVEVYCDECGSYMYQTDADSAPDEEDAVCYDCLLTVE